MENDFYIPEVIVHDDDPSAYVNNSYNSPIAAINQEIRRKNGAAAAAASGFHIGAVGGNNITAFSGTAGGSSSDPWDYSYMAPGTADDPSFLDTPYEEDEEKYDSTTCMCRWKRRTSSWAPTARRSSPTRASSIYRRRMMSDATSARERSMSNSFEDESNNDGKEKGNNLCTRCGKKRPIDSSGFAWSRSYRFRSTAGGFHGRLTVETDLDEPRHAAALLQSTPQLRFLSPASTDMQGTGNASNSSNIFLNFVLPLTDPNKKKMAAGKNKGGGDLSSSASQPGGGFSEYRDSLIRNSANQQAAAELASLLWVLAHEMSLEEYGTVESEVFKSVFALVHAPEKERRMAGLAALDALLAAPSADEEKKSIKFANTLSNGLRAAHGDFEFLSSVSKALGHMAMRTANVDFVESEVTRALEWLRTERSDRRLAACLSLKEFATHLPTTFHSKTSHSTLGQGGSNEFLDHIFKAIRDPQPIVRACATDALSQCLKIIVDRRHPSLTGLLCQVHFNVMEGLQPEMSKKRPWHVVNAEEASRHGSLLAISSMLAYTQDFMLPRFEEICRAVLNCTSNSRALIRLEVIRLLPRLARRCPLVFGRRHLEQSLFFLMESASNPTPPRVGIDLRPSAYSALGQLIIAMTDENTGEVIGGSSLPTLKISDDPSSPGQGHIVELCPSGIIYQKLGEIFGLVRKGLRPVVLGKISDTNTVRPSLHCAASLVEALGDLALPYIPDLIDDMFRAGLSNDLIECLQLIAECVPEQQDNIEDRMLQGVSVSLAGMRDVYDPLASFRASVLHARAMESVRSKGGIGIEIRPQNCVMTYDHISGGVHSLPESGSCTPTVSINMCTDPNSVRALVLSLQTLASFGGAMGKVTTSGAVVPLLPFVQDVAARYLSHPSEEVRRSAALTCCALLVPHELAHKSSRVGSYSGIIIEDVLQKLLRAAVSDPAVSVRLCVVRSLDSRYDFFLCQTNHLQELFLLLQDEALATRAAGLRLLGRLAAINPGPILPVLKQLLSDLILELQCGVDTGRGREEATRLLVVYLRGKPLQRLIHPVLPALVDALPLDSTAPPRLASASLEALGELAQASGMALQPRVKELVAHVLEIMRDRSSASKQRTSLCTLGQIAGSTGYVIRPYLDFPKLLSQATDLLPATKRMPWSLRREVIRTLGIVGALDPDRYHAVASKSRKGGAVGGAYFEVELTEGSKDDPASRINLKSNEAVLSTTQKASTESSKKNGLADTRFETIIDDDDAPAYLSMYEQYAMVAQPVSNLPPAKRITPSDEEFYPTVAIQALMRIFRDPSLAVHHGMVVQAVMFIFKSLNLRCVPYLSKVVPRMIHAVRTCGPSNLRESLLKHLATLSYIVKEHLRPYVSDIFDVVEQFWSSRHLSTNFSLISNLAVGVPDEFRIFVPRLIRRLLTTFDELQIADWSAVTDGGRHSVLGKGREESQKLRLILKSVSNLKGVLGDYLNILVPALLKLADSLASLSSASDNGLPDSMLIELSVLVFRTISSLLESQNNSPSKSPAEYFADDKYASRQSSESGLPSRVVQPIVRIFRDKNPKSPTVGLAMIETLCVCVRHIGCSKWIQLYDGVVRSAISKWQSTFPVTNGQDLPTSSFRIDNRILSCIELYDEAVEEILLPAPQRMSSASIRRNSFTTLEGYQFSTNDFTAFDSTTDAYDPSVSPYVQSGLTSTNKQKVNQGNLQRAWDVSQRASRDDWDEWMRRFAIQLLREAPSPSLRATASLAHAYQPLARELFSAAFACCWKELSEPYRVNLVHALKTAFVADVSPEILQALLNLAEFMEHDPSGGLPIEIPVLADLALKCRAYAKALHYKEREYTMGEGSNDCVESLISINGKLDLPEAALGVLKASSIGEALMHNIPIGDEESSKVSKHQAYEMYYSVLWNTEDKGDSGSAPADLSAREELWLAKLGSWTEALAVYEDKLKRDPGDFEAIVGCMQCLIANGEWQKVLELSDESWVSMIGKGTPDAGRSYITPKLQRKAVRMCAQAAWRLGQWDQLERFSSQLVKGVENVQPAITPLAGLAARDTARPGIDFDGAFYSAILHVHRKEWADAANAIDAARRAMDGRLTALMAESYSRAYPSMVTAQTLAEMEEIVELRKLEERSKASASRHPVNRPNEKDAKERLLSVWRERLAGCRVDAEVHSSILAVRSLVLGPADEVESTLTLSELSRQAQRYKFAERVLLDPLNALGADLNGRTFGFGLSESLRIRVDFSGISNNSFPLIIDRVIAGDLGSIIPNYGPKHEQWSKTLVVDAGGLDRLTIQYRLYFAFVRHLWHTERRDEATTRLSYLCDIVDMVSHCEHIEDTSLRVACWIELGEWKLSQATSPSSSLIGEPLQADVLTAFKRATLLHNCGYRAWHSWALLNFRIGLQMSDNGDSIESPSGSNQSTKVLRNHIAAAVKGFVNAISRGTRKWSASVQQDLLNLLTCLFKYGNVQDVANVINQTIPSVAIEAWLGVLPQLLARIHIKDPSIRSVLHPLLTRLGEKHPQALMYPLSVLVKSPVAERKYSAESLMNSLKNHSSDLVEEALMVSSELIRVAILWLETWHEGLEDASRLYFGEGNVAGMLDLLLPLHENLEKGAETKLENDFLKSFGQDLEQAHLHIKDYIMHMNQTGSNISNGTPIPGGYEAQARMNRQNEEAETAMNRAWDIYYTVFRRINKQLPSLTNLELTQCSPALSRARSLELGVPGSYRVDGSYVKIEKFIPNVEVITSKQRPRKITLRGSDGRDYVFLLKGHEDLRQDERVMQLFGLVNALLVRDPQTRKHDLKIQRYAISPLSHNCGVVGWVPHCDTLHSLIRDYRQAKKIPLNMENREMLKIAPDYDLLTVMQKVEVFVEALKKTTGKGNDLYEIFWLKSTNSEEWLERRTKFTRSLAVMSMVGYILGLGDRHPSNLMLDKLSGRVLHIDFGDCFEVAMNREKYPEQIPFRLTRMLIKAMEVSGIEGSYRSTCERTMSVLRDSRDSLVAMLEAFVYDPLISWRLTELSKSGEESEKQSNDKEVLEESGIGRTQSDILVEVNEHESLTGRNLIVDSISEHPEEDCDDRVEGTGLIRGSIRLKSSLPSRQNPREMGMSASDRARSMQMYTSIQTRAANLATDSRIASITGGNRSDQVLAVEGSLARSRIERSMRQREFMSLIGGEQGAAHEEALNEKALKVIRRVEDKLSGTDFPDCLGEPMDVPDQVQRLIVQATSSENLCQLFIGWCSFW